MRWIRTCLVDGFKRTFWRRVFIVSFILSVLLEGLSKHVLISYSVFCCVWIPLWHMVTNKMGVLDGDPNTQFVNLSWMEESHLACKSYNH